MDRTCADLAGLNGVAALILAHGAPLVVTALTAFEYSDNPFLRAEAFLLLLRAHAVRGDVFDGDYVFVGRDC